jgi:hypothetical protein
VNTAEMPSRTFSWKKRGQDVLTFILHQYIATLGIDIFAGFLVAYCFDVLGLFGKHFPPKIIFWILTGTPYYPVQIGLALLLGWSIGRRVQQKAMLWVWVLPLTYLVYALIAIPTLVPNWIPPRYQAGVGESRFKHYFGWGCGGVHPCFDQNAITVLFYIAAAYSIGALLARTVPKRFRSNKTEIWKSLTVAFIFAFIAVLEIVLTLRQGWKPAYLTLLVTPAGISAFTMLYAFSLRRQSVHPITPD